MSANACIESTIEPEITFFFM